MQRIKILLVLGTRPEAIKLAPVIAELKRRDRVHVITCVTAQQRELLDQVLEWFQIAPDYDLGVMTANQDLAGLTARCCSSLAPVIQREAPDWVVVQGDTTTAFTAALVACYARAKVAHVEAGLSSFDKHRPFPEEINRRLVSELADVHFAPTTTAERNLRAMGIEASAIEVTGNTVIDALRGIVARFDGRWPAIDGLDALDPGKKLIVVTGHRRESFGDGLRQICEALRVLAGRPDVEIVYPVHLNPNVRGPVNAILSGLPNVHLVKPLVYPAFVGLMARCDVILTDSGGVQEEAPSLGKPVLVMRDVTERTEAIDAGAARLTGVDCEAIVEGASQLLDDPSVYAAMAASGNPYGDGRASPRIADALVRRAHAAR